MLADKLIPPPGIPHDGLIRWHVLAEEARTVADVNEAEAQILMAAAEDMDALKKALAENDVPAAKAASARLERRIHQGGLDKGRLAKFWTGLSSMLNTLDAWQKNAKR